jgi:hypothetical protein
MYLQFAGVTDQDNSYAYDLHAAIPYHSLTEKERKEYWDDGLHLTSDGYDWMGEFIATALIKIIKQQRELALPPPPPIQGPRRTRKVAKAEEKALPEEEDRPADISHGYIVVRWRDLD